MQAPSRSVLFVAPEPLSASAGGPARRAVKLAEIVGEHCDVTLAAPSPSVFPEGPFRTMETGPLHDQRLAGAAAGHDVVVVQTLPGPRQLLGVRRRARHLVVDLIAPLALEALETEREGPARAAAVRFRARELVAHLAAADLVLCSNERQRDLLFGAALAAGLLDGGSGLGERLAVVPHGLDASPPPPPRRRVLRGNGFADDARIVAWGGGLWSWLDPLTAIRAVERLRDSQDPVKLAFIGFEHPDPACRRAHESVAAEAMAYVHDHGLGDTVAFRPRWLAREEYLAHLMDADAGVTLHGPTLEGRYATRTRVLDYFEAGLPVVCTSGDTMSDVVASRGLGEVVAPRDVEGCAAALDALTRDRSRLDPAAALEPLQWRNVARPLVEFCLDPRPRADRSRRASLAQAVREYPSFLESVYRAEGRAGLARAALRAGARVLGR